MIETEYMTVAEARVRLGVTKERIAKLIKSGTLAHQDNPLDARMKLVKRADVEALAARSRRAPAPKARAA